jgi:hypothetical protein
MLPAALEDGGGQVGRQVVSDDELDVLMRKLLNPGDKNLW